jgi:hypothetical protein
VNRIQNNLLLFAFKYEGIKFNNLTIIKTKTTKKKKLHVFSDIETAATSLLLHTLRLESCDDAKREDGLAPLGCSAGTVWRNERTSTEINADTLLV